MSARSSRPARSSAVAAAGSSANSSADSEIRRRSMGARSRQWRLGSPVCTVSSGPNSSSTASRSRSAVRRLIPNSR